MGGIKAELNNVLDGVKGLLNNLCTPESEWKERTRMESPGFVCSQKSNSRPSSIDVNFLTSPK